MGVHTKLILDWLCLIDLLLIDLLLASQSNLHKPSWWSGGSFTWPWPAGITSSRMLGETWISRHVWSVSSHVLLLQSAIAIISTSLFQLDWLIICAFFYNQKALILFPLRAVRMKDWVNIYAYYPSLFLGLERQSEAIGIIWTNFYLISKILMKFNIRFKFSQPFIVHLEKNLLRNFFYIPWL